MLVQYNDNCILNTNLYFGIVLAHFIPNDENFTT